MDYRSRDAAMFAIGLHGLLLAGVGLLLSWSVTEAAPSEQQWAAEYVVVTGSEPQAPSVEQLVRATAVEQASMPQLPERAGAAAEPAGRIDAAGLLGGGSSAIHPQVVLGPVSPGKAAAMMSLSARVPEVIGTGGGIGDLPVGVGAPGGGTGQVGGGSTGGGAGSGSGAGGSGSSGTGGGSGGAGGTGSGGPAVVVAAAPVAGNPAPAYPAWARLTRTQGTVVVHLEIGASGLVRAAKVARSSGASCLDDEAVRTARRWRFTPALRNGMAIASEAELPFQFVLGH